MSVPKLPRVDEADRRAWTEPGAELVAPGIHRIPLPLPQDGLRAVNVYAIEDGDGLTLIDGGWAIPEATTAFRAALDQIGHGVEDIKSFLVTHVHRDHYTNASATRAAQGTWVALGAPERVNLDWMQETMRGAGDTPGPEIRALEAAGASDLARAVAAHPHPDFVPQDWATPDEWIADRAHVQVADRTLEAIHTPGHTRGHFVYREASAGALFAGDHVLPHITPSIGFEPVRVTSPLRDYLASLALVREMPDTVLLPAHGPATISVHERVDQLLHHHAQRLDLTITALDRGASTADEVAHELLWTSRHTRLADMDIFNAMLAILETAAHLDVLVERGLASVATIDGVRHYARA